MTAGPGRSTVAGVTTHTAIDTGITEISAQCAGTTDTTGSARTTVTAHATSTAAAE